MKSLTPHDITTRTPDGDWVGAPMSRKKDSPVMGADAELVGQVVLAEWLDSHQWPGWHTGEPAASPVRCFSAGLLIHAGNASIVIAGHWTDEDERQRCGEMTIPSSALVSVRALG